MMHAASCDGRPDRVMPSLRYRSDALRDLGRRAAVNCSASRSVRSCLRATSRFGVLPGAVWKRLPVNLTFAVDVTNGSRFLYRSSPNDQIGRALYWRGLEGHEPETVRAFLHLARTARVVVDVGAHTGLFALLACAVNATSHVVTFEPLPRLRSFLGQNITLNGWHDRVRVLDAAATDHVGTAYFHVPRVEVPTSASLNEAGFRGLEGDIITVPTTTLDAALGPEARVDVVKIDVEGFEDRVLRGMSFTLAHARPAIVLECNPDGPYREVEEILIRHSYDFYHLGPRGPEHMRRLSPDDTEHYRNYLCLPGERRPSDDPVLTSAFSRWRR